MSGQRAVAKSFICLRGDVELECVTNKLLSVSATKRRLTKKQILNPDIQNHVIRIIHAVCRKIFFPAFLRNSIVIGKNALQTTDIFFHKNIKCFSDLHKTHLFINTFIKLYFHTMYAIPLSFL